MGVYVVVVKMGDREGPFEGTVTCRQALPRHTNTEREVEQPPLVQFPSFTGSFIPRCFSSTYCVSDSGNQTKMPDSGGFWSMEKTDTKQISQHPASPRAQWDTQT